MKLKNQKMWQLLALTVIVLATNLSAVGQNAYPATVDAANTRRQAYLRFVEAQRLKSEAQHSQNPQKLQETIEAYKDVIRLDPTAAEPHVDLGELYFFYQSQLDMAEQEAKEAIRIAPKNVDGHLLLARIYVTALRFEKEPKPDMVDRALRAYEEVASLDGEKIETWAVLAELYRLKNDPVQQLHALERWVTAPVSNDASFYRWLMNQDLSQDRAYYELSQLHKQQKRMREALAAATRAYQLAPESAAYSRQLIELLRLVNNIEEELRAYSQLRRTADSPALQIGHSATLVRAGRYKEAVARLAGYVKSNPANVNATILLSIALRRAGQRMEAIEVLKSGIAAVEPDLRLTLMLDLGETYEELGHDESASAQYEQAFELFLARGLLSEKGLESFNQAFSRLARIYRRIGQPDKLQQAFARARAFIGNRSPILDLITVDHLREDGKRREALDLVRTMTRRFQSDRSLKLTEALILGDLRQFNEAADLLGELLSSEQEAVVENVSIFLLLSSIEMQRGQLSAAEASIRKAIALSPNDVNLLIQLGSVLERAGKHEEAEQTLRAVIAREPDNAAALNNLGYFLVMHSARYQEAIALIERAVSIEPLNGNFLDSLGWANYKLGQIEKARGHLEKAVVYSRRNATLHEHLGDVLKELGKEGEARRQWEKALEYSVEADEVARLKDKLKETR